MSGDDVESVTKKPTIKKFQIGKYKVNIIDCPGLQDPTLDLSNHLTLLKSEIKDLRIDIIYVL